MNTGVDPSPRSDGRAAGGVHVILHDGRPGGGLVSIETVDHFTHRSFALWRLPPRLTASPPKVELLEKRVAACIAITDRRILRTYGIDWEAEPAVRVELSRERRLADAVLARDLGRAAPSDTITWLHGLGDVLDRVHITSGLAHGSISPTWICLAADHSPRLDGMAFAADFADAGVLWPGAAWFSSPARIDGKSPDIADDVFGLAALAYWALAGGGDADTLAKGDVHVGMIETLRRSRGLAPTGWQSGWDEAIVAGLSSTPSLRPATPRALITQLAALLPRRDEPTSARPVVARRARGLQAWRTAARRTTARADETSSDRAGARIEELHRLESELAAARDELAAGKRANDIQRGRLEADVTAVARAQRELQTMRDELTATAREFQDRRRKLDENERAVKGREDAAATMNIALSAREREVTEHEAAAAAKERALQSLEAELEQKRTASERNIAAIAAGQEQLAQRQRAAQSAEQELSRRQSELARELESAEATRKKLDQDAAELRAAHVQIREREAAIAATESVFTQREAALAQRADELLQAESRLAADRKSLESTRADIDRLLLENKSILEEAKKAEARIEEARLERAGMEAELEARRSELLEREQKVQESQESVENREREIREREAFIAHSEQTLNAIGATLGERGGAIETEKVVADLLARRRQFEERERTLSEKSAQLDARTAALANATAENERTRQSLLTAKKEVEREQAAAAQARQTLTRDREAWQVEQQRLESELAARVAEADSLGASQLARDAVLQVLSETSAPTTPPPTDHDQPPGSRRWIIFTAAAALAATVVSLLLFFNARRDADTFRQLADAAARKNSLIVVTDPPGAEVSIGGRPLQTSPARFDNLPPGSIQIRTKKPGYRDETVAAEVKPGEPTVTKITLGPPPLPSTGTGTLLVYTVPPGAEVSLSVPGVPRQISPAFFKDLPAGRFAIEANLAGHERGGADITLAENEDAQRRFVLQPKRPEPTTGTIIIETDPGDAMVEIEGQAIPRLRGSPVTRNDLPRGTVKVTVKSDGYDPDERLLQVVPGESRSEKVVLQKKAPPPPPPVRKMVPEIILPPDFTSTVSGASPIRLVRVEPQKFSLNGTHQIEITRPFLIGTREITQEQYQAVIGRNPSEHARKTVKGKPTIEEKVDIEDRGGITTRIPRKVTIPGKDEIHELTNHPVENVSWEDAMAFCRRLTELEAGTTPPGATFRLPTEAEWWLAANMNPRPNIPAWTSDRADGQHRAVPAGLRSERIIHDMFGNVAEWCLDAWNEALPVGKSRDPIAVDDRLRRYLEPTVYEYSVREAGNSGARHVVAGGSFADRESQLPRKPGETPRADTGFRVVLGYPVGTKSDK